MKYIIILPHHFPLPLPLEEPFYGGLRRARLTFQESTAALHSKLHSFSQTFLHCTDTERRNSVRKRKKQKKNNSLMLFLNSQKNYHTFGIKASALPQWITMFHILSSAPPEANIRRKS